MEKEMGPRKSRRVDDESDAVAQVTSEEKMPAISITALHDPIALVHIPIELGEVYTTKLYWTIDRAFQVSGEFFNVTSNRVEIAVFASLELVNEEWASVLDDKIKISSSWRVFEISSGDVEDGGNYDSPHLRHVSAPLAKAGISILYQSSYFTDFLLVRSSDFARASAIFAQQGWHVEPPSTPGAPTRPRSQLFTPSPSCARPPASPWSRQSPPPPSSPEITVLPSPLACVGLSHSSERSMGVSERLKRFIVWPERAVQSSRQSRFEQTYSQLQMQELDLEKWQQDQERSRSPSSTTDSAVDILGETDRGRKRLGRREPENGRPFISYTRTDDGSSLMTETEALRGMFEGLEVDVQSAGEMLHSDWEAHGEFGEDEGDGDGDSDGEGEGDDLSDVDGEVDVVSVTEQVGEAEGEGEDYFTPPSRLHTTGHNGLVTPTSLVEGGGSPRRGSGGSAEDGRGSVGGKEGRHPRQGRGTKRLSLPATKRESSMPISWSGRVTRSVSASRARREGRTGGGGGEKGRKRCLQLDLRAVGEDDEHGGRRGEAESQGTYHMDKSGLVLRFSSLLDSGNIKMLYSSTMHTANVLVEARDVSRAKRLLVGSR